MEEYTGLSPQQGELLNRPLDPKRVKHRQGGGGSSLSYIEGHDAIDTANAIFGYGKWGYETVSNEYMPVLDEKGEPCGGYYAARVRLTVAGCVPVMEEGVNPVTEGRNPRARIDAHDMARKGAITDALKRCLRTYGDQFGNSLYDKELTDGQPKPQTKPKTVPGVVSVLSNKPTAAEPAATEPAWGRHLVQLSAHYNNLFKNATTTDRVKELWVEAEKVCRERGIPEEVAVEHIKSVSLARYRELAAAKPAAAAAR